MSIEDAIRRMARQIRDHGGEVSQVWFPSLDDAKRFYNAVGGDWERDFKPAEKRHLGSEVARVDVEVSPQ